MPHSTTKQEAEALKDKLDEEVKHRPTVADQFTVGPVTDNPVNSQDPYKWSVQLLDTQTGLPAYVDSLQELEELKAKRGL